jgi:hypothetical protein
LSAKAAVDHLGLVDLGSWDLGLHAGLDADGTWNVGDVAAASAHKMVMPVRSDLVEGGARASAHLLHDPRAPQRFEGVVDRGTGEGGLGGVQGGGYVVG